MVSKKSISIFVSTFLIIGFFSLALPEKGYSGLGSVPGGPPCCSQVGLENLCIGGKEEATEACMSDRCDDEAVTCQLFKDAKCVEQGQGQGICVPTPSATKIPTLGGWGFIAMAVVLGIVGFMVIRRRKVRV